MTDLRTAAQQALEALEKYSGASTHFNEVIDHAPAIAALRAALAEPEQEPVAHKHEWFRTGAMEPGEMRCIHCGMWNRKPLTDEELDALRQDARGLNFITLREFRVIARAIEAKHGITGETK